MKEEDEIENAAQEYWDSISEDHPASEEQAVKDAFVEGFEYWQSKLKERDELLAEMAEYIKGISLGSERRTEIIAKYENLKAK